ncbi:MAG: phospho-sugar mutase [Ruminococcaceae bacterium]|nr:phospho-sugar mutase [Oscillospiraceae bacterium]
MNDYRSEYERWLNSAAISENEWQELKAISENNEEIKSRFISPLEFGTAGLRGEMAMGLRQMNLYTVRWTTQAFADLIVSEGPVACGKGVVVCFDCRLSSDVFAHEVARVMAANGIKVRIFDAMRPTPELSFAVRHFEATAGINITASHNPKEYNGYKVYWSDGAQLPPEHAKAIAVGMEKIDIFKDIKLIDFDYGISEGIIEFIGEEVDNAFLSNVMQMSINKDVVAQVADDFKIVYTPFHGTGYKHVPEVLRRLGIKHVYPEPNQMVIDGSFPTVVSPNPENPEGFYLAVQLAKEVGSDLIIGTDPDADRVGIMVRNREGEYEVISGNQTGVLLLDYIINAKKENGTLPENAAFIKTIVTTKMAKEVAERNGIHVDETFTGFKFMAEKLAEYEKANSYQYLLAYEESYGYMMGDYVRDKDAVTASMLLAEMAAFYHSKGMTLLDAISSLFEKYGYFGEKTINIVLPGLDGIEKIKAIMHEFRTSPPTEIAGYPVLGIRDYSTGEITVPSLGVVGETEIVGSNVLYFELEGSTSFIIRPSGTEPKIKVYVLTSGASIEECDNKINKFSDYADKIG